MEFVGPAGHGFGRGLSARLVKGIDSLPRMDVLILLRLGGINY